MKKLITIVEFWIGVNVIGLPIIHTHDISSAYIVEKSKFHR